MVKEIYKGDSGVNRNKIPVTFKVIVPAGEAKPVAPLGPILGQYKVNLIEFCKDFNAKSADYEPGTLLRVFVTKLPNEKTYNMQILPPSVTFLIACQLLTEETGSIELSTVRKIDKLLLFDLIRIVSLLHDIDIQLAAKRVFSYLRSTGIKQLS